jgi:hypothetical protein
MDIRARLGAGDLHSILEQLLLCRLLELDVGRLRGSAAVAELLWAGVARLAPRAHPFKLHIPNGFPGHG